jgi:hypothetical protein
LKRPFFSGPSEAFSDWWNKNKDDIGPGGYFFVDNHNDIPDGFKFFDDPSVAVESGILREAEHLITTDRNGDYGDAVEDFSVTGEYWTTYMKSKGYLVEGVILTPKDVTIMMSLFKIRRESTHPKRDNVVDGCGYLALAQLGTSPKV